MLDAMSSGSGDRLRDVGADTGMQERAALNVRQVDDGLLDAGSLKARTATADAAVALYADWD